MDRPTIRALGVQVVISDDDNRDASASVRVRESGGQWRDGLPLFRVHPETVGIAVPEQLAGSVFDLEPGTEYEIELHFTDPDGLDETQTVMATTRSVPRAEPANPNEVAVSDAGSLSAALGSAAPGDVITLAAGTYSGTFQIQASGTADDPIVIRGEGAVLDGGNCTGCNVLEIYGSYVHLEDVTLQNGERALRFQGVGAEGNVVRRVTIADVVHAIGSRDGQLDFYICDNDIGGRLDWPWVFDADASSHWDDRGIDLNGDGHVVCHNRIEGFGDPMLNLTEGTRSWDFYGNDVYDCFDGIEMDRGAGNVRVFRNRWTNVDSAISMQPVNGGPAYVIRNEVVNAVSEQLKLKQTGGEPSGALVYHNTFVSPSLALNLQTPITVHNFVLANNLFVGPETLAGMRTVDWTAGVSDDRFDYNGYYPDGSFWFGQVGGMNRLYASFAEAMASGEVEANGVLLGRPVFAGDVVGPTDGTEEIAATEVDLDAGSNAVDAGVDLPGVNSGYMDAAPDLGARELGCAAPTFGPRDDESDYVAIDCALDDGGDDGGGETDGDDSGSGDGDGSGTASGAGTDSASGSDSNSGPGSASGDDSNTDGASSGDAAGDSDGGCGCRTEPERPGLLLLALVALIRRRRAG